MLIGIGFNVNQVEFEGELSNIATSLKKEFNMEFEREEIVAKILEKLENRITNIIKNKLVTLFLTGQSNRFFFINNVKYKGL